MVLNISEIKINEGRRALAPAGIKKLAESIASVGLLHPITVNEDNTLVAGYHRLEAAKQLGWTEIECSVRKLESLEAELAEIDENMVRTQLTTTEEGDLLLRRKEIYETLHPETKHGMRNGQTSKDCSLQSLDAKPFVQDAAEKLGVRQYGTAPERFTELSSEQITGLENRADEVCNALLSLIDKIKDNIQ